MKWADIRALHPGKFILIGDIVEEKISPTHYRVLEGSILEVCDKGEDVMAAYYKYKKQGKHILFTLPTTPPELIIETVPIKGVLR